ncbi:MAG TPA: GntR family transcriptional regulator [Sandaracinaceae bacterium LLY-WYZ-13_1]|nr:GntR family transcriptional regulator [Sandaracinaceae bacterium LLY-WYZ-13_1]
MGDTGRKRAVEEAADRVREDILTGHYRPGDHLPGERELATRLGVSRLTLRSALARLEAEGLVRAVHGAGNLVQDYRESGGIDLLGYLAQLAMEGRVVPVSVLGDLLELRRAIAVEALGLAAERGTDAELGALRAHVAHQRQLVADPKAYMEADLHFARLVVRATHNTAFELVFNTVSKAIADNSALELAYYANARQTLQVYERLLEMMEKRDANRVRQVTQRLLDRLDRATLGVIAQLGSDG